MITPEIFYFAVNQKVYDIFYKQIGSGDAVYSVDLNKKEILARSIKEKTLLCGIKQDGFHTIYTGNLPRNGSYCGLVRRFEQEVCENGSIMPIIVFQEPASRELEEIIGKMGLGIDRLGELPNINPLSPYKTKIN